MANGYLGLVLLRHPKTDKPCSERAYRRALGKIEKTRLAKDAKRIEAANRKRAINALG